MLGLRCIYGYLIIYLLSNHLKRSVYSSDPNDTGEGTSNSTLLVGSGSQEGPISQSATTEPETEAEPSTTPETTPGTTPASESSEETTPKPAEGEDEEDEDKVPEFKPNEFKLLTTDQSGQIVELPESDYIHESDRDEHTYDLNENVKCNEIKYENKTVWKLETGSEKYPLYFTYKIEQYKFIVTFEDKFVVCTFENGEWKEKGHSLEQGEAPPETKEMTKIKTTVLDLNDLKNDENYDTVENGNVLTFTPKDNGEFSGVIRTTGEKKVTWSVVWQIQGEFELAKNISFEDFGGGRQVLILDTRSGKKMLYRPKEGEFWKEVAEQPQNAFETVGALIVQGDVGVDMFEVDILKDYKDTKNYVYQEFDTENRPKEEEMAKIEKDRKSWKKKDDEEEQERRPPRYKYQNYAAKEGKGISNIIDPDTAIKADDDDEDDEGFDGSIWRQVNPMQYATHACFRYTPQRCLAILLESANFLLYEEEEDEEKLTEITSKARREFFKLAFYTVVKQSNKYLKLKTENYSRSLLNLSYIFTFDKDMECHRITHDDITVWRHGVDPNFGTLKSIYFHLLEYKLSIENTNDKKVDLDIEQAKNSNLDGSDPILKALKQTPSDAAKSEESTTTEESTETQDGTQPETEEPTTTEETEEQQPADLTQQESTPTEEPTTTEETEEQQPADLTQQESTPTEEPTTTEETEEETPKKEPKKQLTLVQLDLIQTTGSDNFKYVKKNEFATYKAKRGCLFNKVIRSAPSAFSKEEVVWESNDSKKYVKMVRLKLSDNHIALLLNNGEFILFHKGAEDQDWNNITDQRHNFSGFKFFKFDQNDSEYKELDFSSYTMGFNEFSYGVSFNVECHQIKHNDKLIYNYESDEDFGLLKGVYLGLSSNKFFLTNLEEDNKRLDLDNEVTPPKPKPTPETTDEETRETSDQTTDTILKELPEQKTKTAIPLAELTSLNINDTNNTPKYQFSDNGIYKTLTARHGNGFNDVKVGKKSIWKSDNDDYSIKVRLKEASTGEKYLLLLFISKKYQFFYSGNKKSPFEDITDTKHSFSDIKLFSKNETTNVYEQLDPKLYNLSLYHLSLGYRAIEGQKFHLVKFGNDVVYNYKDDENFGDLRAAYLDLIENNLYVMNMNDQTKVVKELSRLKTAIIDLNKSESTDQFQCSKDGDFVTYTSIGNTLFEKLIRSSRLGSDEIIWKVIDNIYAKKILVDGQGKKGRVTNTILHLESGDIKHLNYSDGKWIEVSNKVSLDITKTQGSNEFDYLDDGEFKTFNSKSTFLFNSLVEPDTAGSETVIWKTTNPSEYGNKLVLKDSGNKKYLSMLRVDNKFMLLHKDPSSQNWEDITNTRLNLSDLKMFYFDNDTTGYLLLKDDQYSVSLEKFLYGYEFNSGVECHLVKYRDSVIWNHGDDQELASLKSVFLNLLNNKITILSLEGHSNEINIPGISRPSDIEVESIEEFEEDADSTTTDSTQISSGLSEQSESSTPPITILPENLIELDLNNIESTDNYDYINRNDNHVFTAKNEFRFSKIKKGDHDLKECVDPHYYCKVVANYGQQNKIILYVYKTDKDFDLLLLDDPEPSSHDITSLPSHTVQALPGSGVVSEQLKLLASSEDGQSKELDHNKLNVEKLTHLVNYTFEPDTKCSEIKYNEQTVWKYDKSIHGRHYLTNMLLNTTTSFILVESQNHYQYYYTYINDEWRCISGYKTQDLQPLYPDKLRIFTLNHFGTPVMDDTQFNKSVSGPITSFALNPGSKCVHVKYGEEEVWSYNYKDHENKYPTSVTANIDEKTVMVDSSGTYRYLFSYSAGQFSCVFAFKSRLIDSIDPEKIKFITKDTSGTYVELDKSKYDVEEPDTEYKFTSDSRCTCIKYNNTEVWKHKSQHKDRYPTSVSFNNRNRNYLVVESSRSYRNMFQFENSQFKSLGVNQKLNYDCNSTGVFDPSKLKFLTTDPSDTSKLVELTLNQYSVESPSFITYKFNSVLCKEIGYENQLVWKYDENEHSDDFPTTVSINLKKSYVIVDSSHFYRYVYSYYDKKWKELPFGYKTTNISFDRFKLLTNDPYDQNKLVELDHSLYEMEYSQDVLAIKFNTNVKCTCIMYGNKYVWRYKQNEHEGKYPTTTVFNKKKSIVLVDSGYNYRYLYIYQNKEWKPLPYGYTLRFSSSKYQLFDTKKLQVFTLDKNNTLVLIPINEYDKEDTPTLVSYVFRYSKNCHCVKYDQKVVWEYKQDEHEGKYPPRITLNKKTNIMLIESGYDYRYMFQFENGEWKLLPFSYRFKPKTDLVDPEKIKLLTNDTSDPNKLVELDNSKYDIEEPDDSKNIFLIKFKPDSNCTCIKYDDKDVWKYNRGEHVYKYPTKISLNKNKKFLLVESGYDYRYLFHFENGEWKLLPFGNKFKTTQSYAFDLSKFKLCSIDLSNKPFELDYSKYLRVPNGNILTYTLNPDVKCTEVRYDNISLWNYDDDEHENNYPTTIIFNRNNGFLIVESKDHYESYFSYYDNKWHSVYGYKASKITKYKEFYKLKLYETNEDGLLEPITGFHEEIIGPIITCNIFYGVKCTHVKYDEKTAWAYDSEKHLDYFPTSVVFNITNSTIKVECEDKYVYFSTFINDEWKPFSGFRTQRTNARPEVKLYQKGKSGKYAFIDPSKYNVNWDGENDVYEYDLNNLSCALLKRYENTVWSQTSDEHPKSITYNSDQSKFVLRFDDQYIFCSFEDNEWKKLSRRYGTQSTKKPEQDTQAEDSTEAEDPTQPETEDKEPEPAIQPETEQDSTQTEQQPEESKDSTTGESSSVNPVTLSGSTPGTSEQTESTNEQDSTQTETELTNEQEPSQPEETEEPKQESSQPKQPTVPEESTTSPEESTSD
ncbi:SfiI-subtelomeric fragment related protein family member, putative [Theileria annulata]|uniref:SfiI-subtelomeric related protein family member, putative n=1 Tax=Theileria annulata TaxID=5874 RepID=Q4UHK5_THEAN|nr:SfiI-subtelomeric fragment related protein family member, putative [Theileria annulata]CAI73434.1 SfiI-subtelomeric fragment related protein family member, putative [Theileria annulata]